MELALLRRFSQRSRAHTVLAEVSSSHIGSSRLAKIPVPGGPDVLFWPSQAPVHTYAYLTQARKYTVCSLHPLAMSAFGRNRSWLSCGRRQVAGWGSCVLL